MTTRAELIPAGSLKAFTEAVIMILSEISVSVRAEVKSRIAIRELSMMTDRSLADIGIARHEINDCVRMTGRFAEKNTSTKAEVLQFIPVTRNLVEEDFPAAA